MPGVNLRLSRFRPVWWKRTATIGVGAVALCAAPLLLAGWFSIAPDAPLPEADAPATPEPMRLRAFDRGALDAEAMALIAERNVLSGNRSEFVREEVAVAAQPQGQDRGAADALKRLEEARRDLNTLRLVAILRVGGEWIALFEPAVRAAHEDLLSLRIGDTWQRWEVSSITRDSVRVGFEDHAETINLRPHAGRTTRASAPPRGRMQAEMRPVERAPVRIDPPLSPREMRTRLLQSTRGEDERVRALAEELLKSLDRDTDQ